MVLSLLIPLILLLVCSFSYQKAFAKEKTPDFFRLFMLSAKLDPKIYSVDLHFVLYFIEFWKNMLYFFTFYNKNDCKPLKMININDQYDNLVVYLDKKSHVWDFIAFGTLWAGWNNGLAWMELIFMISIVSSKLLGVRINLLHSVPHFRQFFSKKYHSAFRPC